LLRPHLVRDQEVGVGEVLTRIRVGGIAIERALVGEDGGTALPPLETGVTEVVVDAGVVEALGQEALVDLPRLREAAGLVGAPPGAEPLLRAAGGWLSHGRVPGMPPRGRRPRPRAEAGTRRAPRRPGPSTRAARRRSRSHASCGPPDLAVPPLDARASGAEQTPARTQA